jgi:CDP-glucose 4,6-dehydratase
VERVAELWPGPLEVEIGNNAAGEATWLALDSAKARAGLDWTPAWGLEEGLEATIEWYAEQARGADVRGLSVGQLAAFSG